MIYYTKQQWLWQNICVNFKTTMMNSGLLVEYYYLLHYKNS